MKVTAGQSEYGYGKCKKCRQIIPLEDFPQWFAGEQRHRSRSCCKCDGRTAWEGRESPLDKGPAYWKNCEIIRRAKNVPCADCGRQWPPVCMDFDHRPEHGKAHNVGELKSRRKEILHAEIAKCDVVCACCHRLRTEKRGYARTGRPVKPPPDTAEVARLGR